MAFAAISIALMSGVALVLGAALGPGGARRAIATSGLVAFVVQVGSFAILRRMRGRHLMVAWGLGALTRFLVLAAYAFVAVRAWRLDPTAALLSLVSFFVVSTLAEPWLLRS